LFSKHLFRCWNLSVAWIAINNTVTFFISNSYYQSKIRQLSPQRPAVMVYTNRALSDEFCYLTMSISSLDMHVFSGAAMSGKRGPKYDRKRKFASQLMMVFYYKAIFSMSSSLRCGSN
jgi:hypothetical protein